MEELNEQREVEAVSLCKFHFLFMAVAEHTSTMQRGHRSCNNCSSEPCEHVGEAILIFEPFFKPDSRY